MSRSFKQNYSAYVGYKSNKAGKRQANKSLRREEKKYLRGAGDLDFVVEPEAEEITEDVICFYHSQSEDKALPMLREVSDVYDFPSDGLPSYRGRGLVRK